MPEDLVPEDEPREPEKVLALALSGGGYRAAAFHLGALIRLNEAGLLSRLARISSVSGGSIPAATLGANWSKLTFDGTGVATNFDIFIEPVRQMLATTIDIGAVIGGILLPGTIGERVAKAYDKILFQGRTLQDLPDDQDRRAPRFVINATNVRSAALWRFSRRYMGDYRVGLVIAPTTPLATAVAASSAFPPFLSPMPFRIEQPFTTPPGADLTRNAYRGMALLSDGGVYDNLGLEVIEKQCATLLVSDAGQKIRPDPSPAETWAQHSLRVLDIIDDQVRSLRKRRLIDSYLRRDRTGAYWTIRARIADYIPATDPLGCAGRDPSALAAIPTRLEAMPTSQQERVINWGYAICDSSLRRFFSDDAQVLYGVKIDAPGGFPYARGY